ncbi:heat shock 70 kDa protein 12A-like [Ruditapes philippinarum]|uniref:heat shock 70 kDa protein 12A-like n=1 Tax=Ruditapes philippinarum TaxID=129788 RepID=UPI00295AA296|nr:heat shock 70 kDa protein 12A-like [Ruditapes philippinarum]
MVIDLGGGTVDITVHKVNQDGKLHEVYPPSGGPWGGTLVDEHIYNFLEDIFGRTVLEILKQESCTEMLDMVRTLELKKRQFKSTSDDEGKVNLTLPSSLFEIYQEENKTEDITDKLKRMYPKNEVTKKRGRLIIDEEIFSNMFEESIESLTDNIKAIFARPDMESINTLVLVGGYSECEILKTTIRETFRDKRVIIPEEAATAVVKGAVLFGHDQRVIDSRRSPCTYGVSIAVPFDPQRHPPMHKYKDMCEDVFKVFIQIGEKIKPGITQRTHSFNTSESSIYVEIYKSILEEPAFITDTGCEKLGVIDLRQLPGRATRVDIIMKFGDTELHVEAKEHGTENKVGAQFNFLR